MVAAKARFHKNAQTAFPSPRWGEGKGEGVRGSDKRYQKLFPLIPCPSPLWGEGRHLKERRKLEKNPLFSDALLLEFHLLLNR
jgi:hypothetical protein